MSIKRQFHAPSIPNAIKIDMALRLRRRAFVNQVYGIDRSASIA